MPSIDPFLFRRFSGFRASSLEIACWLSLPGIALPFEEQSLGSWTLRCPMASHQLTIERAKFSAGLLKPDITTISRDQVTVFLELFDNAVSRCSPSNIQVWSDYFT